MYIELIKRVKKQVGNGLVVRASGSESTKAEEVVALPSGDAFFINIFFYFPEISTINFTDDFRNGFY